MASVYFSLTDWHAHLGVNDSISLGGVAHYWQNNLFFQFPLEARKSIEGELTAHCKQTRVEPINIKLITDSSTRVAGNFQSNLCKLNAFPRCDVYVSCLLIVSTRLQCKSSRHFFVLFLEHEHKNYFNDFIIKLKKTLIYFIDFEANLKAQNRLKPIKVLWIRRTEKATML